MENTSRRSNGALTDTSYITCAAFIAIGLTALGFLMQKEQVTEPQKSLREQPTQEEQTLKSVGETYEPVEKIYEPVEQTFEPQGETYESDWQRDVRVGQIFNLLEQSTKPAEPAHDLSLVDKIAEHNEKATNLPEIARKEVYFEVAREMIQTFGEFPDVAPGPEGDRIISEWNKNAREAVTRIARKHGVEPQHVLDIVVEGIANQW